MAPSVALMLLKTYSVAVCTVLVVRGDNVSTSELDTALGILTTNSIDLQYASDTSTHSASTTIIATEATTTVFNTPEATTKTATKAADSTPTTFVKNTESSAPMGTSTVGITTEGLPSTVGITMEGLPSTVATSVAHTFAVTTTSNEPTYSATSSGTVENSTLRISTLNFVTVTKGSPSNDTSKIVTSFKPAIEPRTNEPSQSLTTGVLVGVFIVSSTVFAVVALLKIRRIGPFRPGRGYALHFSHTRERREDKVPFGDLFDDE